MFEILAGVVRAGFSLLNAAIPFGIKPIKYFIDSVFRDKVKPVPGSVLYCDLWIAAEHSGIYVGGNEISNIVVDGVADSSVCLSSPRSFTSKSTMGRKIYVSCDPHGAVGNSPVAYGARSHVGERSFYGLVVKNCHEFSTKCVNYADSASCDGWSPGWLLPALHDETWEPTLRILKDAARSRLGATKWRLWDWESDAPHDTPPEPDWDEHTSYFQNQPLNPTSIARLRMELDDTRAYMAEIEDENIPSQIRVRLSAFQQTLADISQQYDDARNFLASCPDARFSYNDLRAIGEDFTAMAKVLRDSAPIQDLVRKMGRQYISEEKKKRIKVAQRSASEVYGTHRSDDLMRMLPSELLNLEDEALEMLFYARLLEKNLLTYELSGTDVVGGEEAEQVARCTGPIVACLDTSGSMQGEPLLKAKALLLAISNILKKEGRALHVLLFGATGEIREFATDRQNDSAALLCFLRQGFGGGTDFETPLQRAFEIIAAHENRLKADVLMISDGDCRLSPEFARYVSASKASADCSIYTVLCAGARSEDSYSDEVMLL